MLIGLTGGIGCGKSSAAAFFAEHFCRVIDVDRIVREEILPCGEVINLARTRWGASVVTSNGGMDRAAVAEIVFTNARERSWWESVVHPRVGKIWRSKVMAAPDDNWVVEVPLLFEAGLEKGFDFIVCVGANRTTQMARLVARGVQPAQAELRIAAQLPLETKLNLAHVVLWNEGSREFLRDQISACLTQFRCAAR